MEKTKRCIGCKSEKPLTPEHYSKASRAKDGFQRMCRECNKQYYEANKEKILQEKKQYYQASKERILKEKTEYYAKNQSIISERKKQYYEAHKEMYSQKYKRYRQLNKEKISKHTSLYRKANPDKHNVSNIKRMSLKKLLPSTYSAEQWAICRTRFNGSCAYCGKQAKLQQDHFIAVANGGSYTRDNIIPACGRCNASKRDTPFGEWYHRQPFYSKKREQDIYNYLNQNYIGEQTSFNLGSLQA